MGALLFKYHLEAMDVFGYIIKVVDHYNVESHISSIWQISRLGEAQDLEICNRAFWIIGE